MSEPVQDQDLDLRAIAVGAASIALMIVLAAGAAWLGWNSWEPPGARGGPNGPMDFGVAGARLESAPFAQRDAYFAQKQRVLQSWGWVDREAGIARIPIDDAMRLMAAPEAARGRVQGGSTQGGKMQGGKMQGGKMQGGETQRGKAQHGVARGGQSQGGESSR